MLWALPRGVCFGQGARSIRKQQTEVLREQPEFETEPRERPDPKSASFFHIMEQPRGLREHQDWHRARSISLESFLQVIAAL